METKMNRIDMARLSSVNPGQNRPGNTVNRPSSKGLNFEQILEGQKSQTAVKFSKHAEDRMQSRNIVFTDREIEDIGKALVNAEKKGVKDTLILTDKAALIASAKNKTVITTVPKDQLRENVFTNIDGAIII